MSGMGNKRVGVIGAGTMGRGIAQVFAQSGYEVGIFDTVPAAIKSARAQIDKMLDRAVEKNRMSAQDAVGAKGRIHPVGRLSELGTCSPDPR